MKSFTDEYRAQIRNIKAEEKDEARLFTDLGLRGIRDRLEKSWELDCEVDDIEDFDQCLKFQKDRGMEGNEIHFVPDRRWYRKVLRSVQKGSVVLDAGAGDLRFSLALATKVKKVYAVEINPTVLGRALGVIGYDLPENVIPICTDAFRWPVPPDVDTVVCILIHRGHEFPSDWKNRTIIHAEHTGLKTEKPNKTQTRNNLETKR